MRVVTGVVVLEVKKFAFGALWKLRTGAADLKIDLDATPKLEVSRNGCRIVKAMLKIIVLGFNQLSRWEEKKDKSGFCL